MLFRSFITAALLASGAFANMHSSSNDDSDNSSKNDDSSSSSNKGYDSSSSSDKGSSSSSNESSSSSSSSSAAAAASEVQVQVVQVSNANGSLQYFPDELTAAPGSFVQFQFWPKNHTVTQSTFANPCVPLTKSMPNVTSMIKSGFVPVAADATEIPVYTIQINNTKPLWLYCGQTGHCAKGMVMAINVNNSSPNTLDAYKSAAAQFSESSSGTATSSSGSESSSASSTESSSPAQQTTNAASKPVAGWLGVGLALVAGVAALL